MNILKLNEWANLTDVMDLTKLDTPKDQDIELIIDSSTSITLHFSYITAKSLKRELKKSEPIYFPSLKPEEDILVNSLYTLYSTNDYSFLEEEFQLKKALRNHLKNSVPSKKNNYFAFINLSARKFKIIILKLL
ncbi:MAG: hypothetical protein ACMXX9_02140 [Candidatus Woesearchaeota archaeon]